MIKPLNKHICPWWLGYFLLNPLRKLIQNPEKILSKYVREEMTVIDYGCGMGYFSLPLAKLVGDNGRVICIDAQEKMLNSLRKRAVKAGVIKSVTTKLIDRETPEFNNQLSPIDFVLLFAAAHEVSNQEILFHQLFEALKNNGKMLFVEPAAHVSKKNFEQSLSLALKSGFKIIEYPKIRRSLSVLLSKD